MLLDSIMAAKERRGVIQHSVQRYTSVNDFTPWGVTMADYITIVRLISQLNRIFGINFVILPISSWHFHDVCQRFIYNQKRNLSWIRQKMRNFPINPHYKKSPAFVTSCLYKRYYKKLAIFIMRHYGENLCLLSGQAEIIFLAI